MSWTCDLFWCLHICCPCALCWLCSYSSSTARKPDFETIMLSLGIPLLRTYCLLFKMSLISCGILHPVVCVCAWHLARRANRKVCSPTVTPPLLESTFFPCISNVEGYRCKEVQSANYLCLFQTNRLTQWSWLFRRRWSQLFI